MSRTFDMLRQSSRGSWPQPVREVSIPPAGEIRLRGHGPANPTRDSDGWDWLEAVRTVAKYWKLSALFAAAVFLTVAVVTFLMKPVYEPIAKLEVDPPGAEMFSLNGNASSGGDSVGEYLGTQVQKLQGDDLAIGIIRKFQLDQNPEFGGKAARTSTPSETPDGPLTPAENAALRAFRLNLAVKPEGGSRIIKVSFAANDPVLAANVANSLAQSFVERTYNERHAVIMKSSAWLAKQLDDIKDKMDKSNKELAAYETQSGITDVDEKQNTYGLRLAELNHQLTAAQADRIQNESLVGEIHSGSDEQLPQVRDNPVIQALTQKLADCKTQLAEAQVIYGPSHPNVKKLQNQENELETQLASQRKHLVRGIEQSYSAAKVRENLTASELKSATGEASRWGHYIELRKEAETNRELYNNLYAQVKQAGIIAASKSSNVRVVDAARVLDMPTRPRRVLNLGLGLIAGLSGGILLAFLRQSIDKTVRTPEDVRKWAGISSVSIIPVMEEAGPGKLLSSQKLGLVPLKNGIAARRRVSKILIERPRSAGAEAMRNLETSILLSRPDSPPRVVLVISPFPGEGKTTVAVNLAIMLSGRGTTCLVDADLRRPSIAGLFDCAEGNMSDVLSGETELDVALAAVPEVPNLTVLASKVVPANPAELISSESMQKLIADLRTRFDFVVIDSPPILPFADGRILSAQADGLVFVSRSGSTSQESVARSMDMLSEVHAAPVLGFVLNGVEYPRAPGYYGYGEE